MPRDIDMRLRKSGSWYSGKHGLTFCRGDFEKVTRVPENAKRVYLVISADWHPHGYEIMKPRRRIGPFGCVIDSGIKSIRRTLVCRDSLAALYNLGYRYIRVEYVEED